eukprot:1144499-Pelagomonas_calceolata.AAC.11
MKGMFTRSCSARVRGYRSMEPLPMPEDESDGVCCCEDWATFCTTSCTESLLPRKGVPTDGDWPGGGGIAAGGGGLAPPNTSPGTKLRGSAAASRLQSSLHRGAGPCPAAVQECGTNRSNFSSPYVHRSIQRGLKTALRFHGSLPQKTPHDRVIALHLYIAFGSKDKEIDYCSKPCTCAASKVVQEIDTKLKVDGQRLRAYGQPHLENNPPAKPMKDLH